MMLGVCKCWKRNRKLKKKKASLKRGHFSKDLKWESDHIDILEWGFQAEFRARNETRGGSVLSIFEAQWTKAVTHYKMCAKRGADSWLCQGVMRHELHVKHLIQRLAYIKKLINVIYHYYVNCMR